MITKNEYEKTVKKAIKYFAKAGIFITENEKKKIEVVDFGLSRLEKEGLQILTYVNTDRCCAKELVLFPGQSCCEHRHPPVKGNPGKEETFRCRYGKVFLYVEGRPSDNIKAEIPNSKPGAYTVFHEIVLNPGDQHTMNPNTLHWFQAGPKGAVLSEFSTSSIDEADIFSDKDVKRETVIK